MAILGGAFVFRRRRTEYSGKKALVVGGSSGLGLSLAEVLRERGAAVTITSRDSESARKIAEERGVGWAVVDVCDEASVGRLSRDFDFIFACAGYSSPSSLAELRLKTVKETMETNFYGAVSLFLHFIREKAPKKQAFVFVSSTLGLHSFTGYASYAPSKSALRSFYESVRAEAALMGMDLFIYYVSTINSPGLEREDRTKPRATFEIEGASRASASPRGRALKLLAEMECSNTAVSDFTTRLFLHSTEITRPLDILCWLLAPLFWALFKGYAHYQTRRHFAKTGSSAQ